VGGAGSIGRFVMKPIVSPEATAVEGTPITPPTEAVETFPDIPMSNQIKTKWRITHKQAIKDL
jgi:hypothetical protein